VGEICIAYVQSFERPDPLDIGFDAAVEFPPNLSTPPDVTSQQWLINDRYSGQVLDWREVADDYRRRPPASHHLFPGVNCGWDNEPRRAGAGRTYLHASPHTYRNWLQDTIERRVDATQPDRLVFINAWNEWAEGAVLEPDARLGHAWLQATRCALQGAASAERLRTRPCVVIHGWYEDGLAEVLELLAASGMQHRLVITTSSDKREPVAALLTKQGFEQAELYVYDNRGRDILPFLHVAHRLRDQGEDVVLKLHTKRSTHRSDGERWRNELLGLLLPSHLSERIPQSFAADSRIGIAAPDGHVLPLSNHWGGNENIVRHLARRMTIATQAVDSGTFVSGSMFWVRLNALAPLLNADLNEWEFEDETGQTDGTLAHAIERIFSLCAEHAGFKVLPVSSLSGVTPPAAPSVYPFADRG